MLKIIHKILTGIKVARLYTRANLRILLENPLFCFGLVSVVLFWGIFSSCNSLANGGNLINNKVMVFNTFDKPDNSISNSLFSSQANAAPLETPDLKIMQGNTLCGVATPCVVSGKVLGDIFGTSVQNQKEITDYLVQAGDTLQSVADLFKISVNTIIWANDLTSSSAIKVGQSLVILPTDGVLHIVKAGDTMDAISQTYKAQSGNIISYNDLANQDDIYIGDILVVPGGTMPKKAAPSLNYQAPLASNYFIYPTQGYIAQRLHYYNAVDIANKCGTPIYAAAAGVVQRAVANGGYNSGMGNHMTILHGNGTTTYYGHLMTLFVKTGEKVYTGQNIGLMGGEPGMAGAGKSTGCHVHFQVMGAQNWLTTYSKGAVISYK